MKRGIYDTNNQPKRATFKYEQEGQFCLGVAKKESKDGTITGNFFPVYDYTNKEIVTIDSYKKYIMNNHFFVWRCLASFHLPSLLVPC